MQIVPVILSGGSGTRLWPLSREEKPKQFLDLGLGGTLFAKTLRRCSGSGFSPRPIVVAAEQHVRWLQESLEAERVAADLVLEPVRRDTCAAVIAGALRAAARDPDSLVLVVAADHLIPDEAAFRQAVIEAVPAAEAGWIVAFGISPADPATGFGYIAPGQDTVAGTARRVVTFREKPDRATAEAYIQKGYLWNSGNFLFCCRHFLDEARRLVPDTVTAVERSFAAGETKNMGKTQVVRLNAGAFAEAQCISLDYAIMEKTRRAAVAPVAYAWNDVGSWDAMAHVLATPGSASTVVGKATVDRSSNVLVWTDGPTVAVTGCEDLIVVAAQGAVLVARKGSTEQVKFLAQQVEGMQPAAEIPGKDSKR